MAGAPDPPETDRTLNAVVQLKTKRRQVLDALIAIALVKMTGSTREHRGDCRPHQMGEIGERIDPFDGELAKLLPGGIRRDGTTLANARSGILSEIEVDVDGPKCT